MFDGYVFVDEIPINETNVRFMNVWNLSWNKTNLYFLPFILGDNRAHIYSPI